MRKGFIVFAVIALVAVGAFFITNSAQKGGEAVATSAPVGQTQEKVFPVTAAQAVRNDVLLTSNLNLTFTPSANVPVVAKVSGNVSKVLVSVGDKVAKDAILFTIDDQQYRLQAKQAEAALEAAQANLAQLRKGASTEDLRQAEAAVAQAEASLAGAKKGLENAEKMLTDRTQYKQQLQGAQSQAELAKSQLDAAKVGVEQAKTAYDNAQAEYQRMQELYAKEMISRQQLDGVKLQFESAKAQHESAQERVKQAEIGVRSAQDALVLAQETYDDPLSITSQVDAAKTQYEVAKAGLAAAQARLASIKKGATTEQVDAVEAQVKQAQTALELAQLQLEYTKVTAPISGQVAQLNVQLGSVAAPGSPVAVIVDNSAMKGKAFVPESYINKVAVGQRVALTATALPGVTFYGQVTSVSPMADPQTRQFPIEIKVINEDGKLKAGMFGTVSLVIGEAKNALTIPVSTVLYDRGKPFVYKVVDGRAQEQYIELGLSDDQIVEVLSGLDEGAVIINDGRYQVKNGALVEVK